MIIELPQVGESVTEGVIGKWLKSVGERVERFDPLVEVVTDKVNMEMPSPVTGTLTAVLVSEGDTVPMGAPIAEMEVDGETPVEASAASIGEEAAGAAQRASDRIGTLLKDVAPVGPTGLRRSHLSRRHKRAGAIPTETALLTRSAATCRRTRCQPRRDRRNRSGRAGYPQRRSQLPRAVGLCGCAD